MAVSIKEPPRTYHPLRAVRLHAGLSQVQLAAAMGIHPALVSSVECGTKRSWPRFRREAARALRVPEAVLFPDGA